MDSGSNGVENFDQIGLLEWKVNLTTVNLMLSLIRLLVELLLALSKVFVSTGFGELICSLTK